MQKCSVCASNNLLTSQYCERCGSPLKTSASTVSSEIEYTDYGVHIAPPPPPPTQYGLPYPYVSTTTPSTAYTYQYPSNDRARPGRTIGDTVLGILLYLIGASSTAIGTFGMLQSYIGDSWAVIYLLCVLLASIAVMVIVLIRYQIPHLRWWLRLLWWAGLSFGIFILMLIGYMLLSALMKDAIPATTEDLFFGSSLILYGLLAMFVALW